MQKPIAAILPLQCGVRAAITRRSGNHRRICRSRRPASLPGLVGLIERHDAGELRPPEHVGRDRTSRAGRSRRPSALLGGDAPHFAEDEQPGPGAGHRAREIPVEPARPIRCDDDSSVWIISAPRVPLAQAAASTTAFHRFCSASMWLRKSSGVPPIAATVCAFSDFVTSSDLSAFVGRARQLVDDRLRRAGWRGDAKPQYRLPVRRRTRPMVGRFGKNTLRLASVTASATSLPAATCATPPSRAYEK